MQQATRFHLGVVVLAAATLIAGGCTCPLEYLRNGCKVGPNVGVTAPCLEPHWIDSSDARLHEDCADLYQWWTIFQDPALDELVAEASSQNLSLREAGFRVLEARAALNISAGNLWPQSQTAGGGYQRLAESQTAGSTPGFSKQFFDQWALGFNLNWEIDFWGRFRRAVTAAEETLDASSANYDQVMVTLVADVAANYVEIRTLQQRIAYLRSNVELQNGVFGVAERRFKAGSKGALDYHQAGSTLALTQAQIPQLQLGIRQASDRLCVLLGKPPADIEKIIGDGTIPKAPETLAIGIPCELLCRRPDVRRAQHLAAAQGEEIGIAEADLYPMLAINGTIGWQAEKPADIFTSKALTGNIGPVFQWNILNYGRIRNNMRMQDARFRALVAEYQHLVLQANAEVEDGLAKYLRAQERANLLDKSVGGAQEAVTIVNKEYQGGAGDYTRVAQIQETLVQQQDLQAQAHGEIAMGLIQVYRALGGGWQCGPSCPTETTTAAVTETAPMPPQKTTQKMRSTPTESDSILPPDPAKQSKQVLPLPELATQAKLVQPLPELASEAPPTPSPLASAQVIVPVSSETEFNSADLVPPAPPQ